LKLHQQHAASNVRVNGIASSWQLFSPNTYNSIPIDISIKLIISWISKYHIDDDFSSTLL